MYMYVRIACAREFINDITTSIDVKVVHPYLVGILPFPLFHHFYMYTYIATSNQEQSIINNYM